MARSRKTSPAEDLVASIALLPWWAGVAIAVGSYAVLHGVATQPLPGRPEIGVAMFLRGLAIGGQYLLPLLALVAAALSAWRRRRRGALHERVADSDDRAVLDAMSWHDFERLVGEAYRRQGYRVVERGGSSADGGVDVVLHRDGGEYFVQCKQWKTSRVGVTVVRQLGGVVAAHGARGGFVITSGVFTPDAIAFARRARIELVDGARLHALIRGIAPATPRPAPGPDAAPAMRANEPPSCPTCASSMVRRTARNGANAGSAFWGCASFPACRGTRRFG